MITKRAGGAVLATYLLSISMTVFAAKPCEELKAEIDAKFKVKGVQNYTLDIVVDGVEDSGKTVGTCDGGTKHISYKRNSNKDKSATAEAAAVKP